MTCCKYSLRLVLKLRPWNSCTLHSAFLQYISALYHVQLIGTMSLSRHNVRMIDHHSQQSMWSVCRVNLAKGKSQMPTCRHHPGWAHSPRNPPLCLLLSCDPPLLPPGLVQRALRFQEQPLSPYLLHQSCPQGRRHHRSCHHLLRAQHSWLHHRCAPRASLWSHHKCPP